MDKIYKLLNCRSKKLPYTASISQVTIGSKQPQEITNPNHLKYQTIPESDSKIAYFVHSKKSKNCQSITLNRMLQYPIDNILIGTYYMASKSSFTFLVLPRTH